MSSEWQLPQLSIHICFSFILSFVCHPADGSTVGVSLYHPNEPILQLTNTNFSSVVLNANRSHLVEFYNTYCGHCRHFAPVYRELGNRVKEWSPVVALAAVNCAIDESSDLCLANAVDGVPALKFFPPATGRYDLAKSFSADSSFRLKDLTTVLIRALVKDTSGYSPSPNKPDFSFLDNNITMADVWSSLPLSVTHVALVFEDAETPKTSGAELILDFIRHEPIRVKRVKNDHQLVQTLRVSDVPTVLVFSRTWSMEVLRANVHPNLHKQILALLHSSADELSTTTIVVPQTGLASWTTTEAVLIRMFYVSETDLLLAIKYSFHHEVGVKNLNGTLLRILQTFVNFTAMYSPPSIEALHTLIAYNYPIPPRLKQMSKVRAMLRDLDVWLRWKVSSIRNEGDIYVTGSEWRNKWTEMETRHLNPFPGNATYDHCKGSREGYRGYSCGLWHVLHTLTVNAYLTHGVGSANTTSFDPVNVLTIIRNYIVAFFGCEGCVRHFTRLADVRMRIQDKATSSFDVILWMWKAHNVVNQRLEGDPVTEDPQFPKRQFPPSFLCAQCQDSYGDWDSGQVTTFMVKYFTNVKPFRNRDS